MQSTGVGEGLWANREGAPQLRCSQWLAGRLPMMSTKGLVGWTAEWLVASLWWVLSPGCCSPSLSQPFNCPNHLNVVGEEKKKWTSLAVSYTVGGDRCSLTHSLSPRGKIKRISLVTKLCHLGGGVLWVKWNCSYPLPSVYFFAPKVCLNFAGLLDFQEGTRVHGWLSKSMFYRGNNCRQLLFYHVADVTLSEFYLQS